MREVCEDSLWWEVVGEKLKELGEPVREDRDASRSCKVAVAGGLNERVVAIFYYPEMLTVERSFAVRIFENALDLLSVILRNLNS
jgi:hypothetical protein